MQVIPAQSQSITNVASTSSTTHPKTFVLDSMDGTHLNLITYI
jgi:hypothetical protein